MRPEAPARFFVTGKPHKITDELYLRTLMGFERTKGAYILGLQMPLAVKDWPSLEAPASEPTARVNDYVSVESDVVLFMVRSKKLTPNQGAFEADERTQILDLFAGGSLCVYEDGETLSSISAMGASHILQDCPPDILTAYGHSATAAVKTLYWLVYSGQMTHANMIKSLKYLYADLRCLPFDLEEWIKS
ncbi:hypothetical protein ACFSM5_07835 [Lacibacterium aquatile]|uniref:Uncharacterized protein n=1 Tax=Lacibacterium aquatile TaxID=1168082 RepID=A0ABW5DU53_9PROT